MNNDILIKRLAKTLSEVQTKKTSPYDTQAEVRRVDGDVAWVHIPGGVEETPVQLTTSAKKGDIVQVRVSGGRAWLYGNATSPPTDDTSANEAKKTAASASEHAINAVTEAGIAKEAADSAQASAASASASAAEANTLLGQMQNAATAAGTTLTQIYQDAKDAETSAANASESATSANISALTALDQLSVVENVVGVLDLLTKNGDYRRTTDPEPLQDKWYFTRTGSGTSADPYEYQVVNGLIFEYILTSDTDIVQGKTYYTRSGSGTEEDPYAYTQVENPVIADIGTYYEYTNWNYFELVGIDTAIQNYVSSHIALAGNTLYLQNGNTQIALSTTDGMTLFSGGSQIAQYGENAVLGNPNDFHVTIIPNHFVEVVEPTGNPSEQGWYELDGDEYVLTEDTTVETGKTYYDREVGRLSFWRGPENNAENEVAYISGNKLYITQSVVLQQMDVGKKVADEGLGQWSWKVHGVNGKNNLYLKWFG